MASREKRKRLTLSEHLALRAQAAQRAEEREQERIRRLRTIDALESVALCTCPACVRRRAEQRGGQ